MQPFDIAKTQLELAYLFTKLSNIIGQEPAIEAISRWLYPDLSNPDEFTTRKVLMYCTGKKMQPKEAAQVYHALGFTHVEIGRFINKSHPYVADLLRKPQSKYLFVTEGAPVRDDMWERCRTNLDRMREKTKEFDFRAKNSIF